MEERILDILEVSRNNAINLKDIYKKSGYTNYTYEQFLETVDELKEKKLIYCVGGDNYTLNPFVEGIFHIKRNGDCYVSYDNKTININKEYKKTCFEGDKVLARITDFNNNTGTIKKIIERKGIIAEVKTINKERYAVIGKDMYKINLDDKIVDGMLIGIKIDKTKEGKYYRATLDTIIGHKNAPKLEENKILYANNFTIGFTEESLKELDYIPASVLEKDFNGRRDLRDKMIFTIDGDDTKDIDDAISIDILENGNYKLGVHIADVTNYVKENSKLDLEAREKATSVYMPGVVSPMYPPQLSNGICSLNPDVDRLALSCEMEFDKQGKLITFDIFKSIIHSNIQMTYKKVNKILNENIVEKDYEKYVEALNKMEELAKILRNSREKRGMLNFDLPEKKININENNEVESIELRLQDTGETLIEDFMLAANETVATYIYNMGVESIYRIHEYPDEERLKNTLTILKTYGVDINIKVNMADPKVIQKILKELETKENKDIFIQMILRCMAKAKYTTQKEGHFGIGVDSRKGEYYTHFTSPIRRYPDTTVHRVLHLILNGEFDKLMQDLYKSKLEEIAIHSSNQEISAEKCEKQANKYRMAQFMQNNIGEQFIGKINGFTKNGMFIELDNLVEGRMGFETMDDYYNYDEELQIIIGERTNKIYRLGDTIEVTLTRSDPENYEIDFEPIKKIDNKVKKVKQNGNTK